MTTKIVNLLDYKYEKKILSIKSEIGSLGREYKYALSLGVCDICSIAGEDVRKFTSSALGNPIWCCDGCVPELANEL